MSTIPNKYNHVNVAQDKESDRIAIDDRAE
jgi:hypothetical protein